MRLKKLISYLTLSFLILSMLSVSPASSAEEARFQEAEYTEETAFLAELGLLDLDIYANSNSDVTITRGEMAAMAVNILGIDTQLQNNVRFHDVSSTHPYFADIGTAVGIGLMSGKSKDSFEPDTPLAMNEAVKISVCMLGYGPRAESVGGYPGGYLKIAHQTGITEGITISEGKKALRGQVLRLMANTVRTDMVIIDGYLASGNTVTGNVYKGRNILSEIYGIYMHEAIVEADDVTAIYGKKTPDGYIKIGETIYENLSFRAKGMVGKNVEFYYKNDNTIPQLISLKEKHNSEVVINGSSDYFLDFAEGTYYVDQDGDRNKFKIGKEYILVYNDVLIDGSDESLMSPQTGSVRLLDNDGDGIYDVVFVDEYFNLIVKQYNTFDRTFYDMKDAKRKFALDDFEKVTFQEADKTLQPENIEANAILSIKKTPRGEETQVLVSSKKKSGVLTLIDRNNITIGNDTYKVSNDFRTDFSGLTPGTEYVFYLDSFNEIVYYTVSQARELSCFLDAVQQKGLSSAMELMLLMSDGTRSVVKTTDKISIVTYEKTIKIQASEIFNYITTKKLIMYEKNEDKLVDTIILPYVVTTAEEYKQMADYPLVKLDYMITDWPDVDGTKSVTYQAENRTLDTWMPMSTTSMVFCVPPSGITKYNDHNVGVVPLNKDLPFVVDVTLTAANSFEAYATGDNKLRTDVLVYYTSNPKMGIINDQATAVVTKVSYVYNESDGETYPKLELNAEGAYKEIIVDDESLIYSDKISLQSVNGLTPNLKEGKTKIECGDIIKYSTDSYTGKTTNIALMYDMKNDRLSYDLNTKNALFRLFEAEVTEIDGLYAEFRVGGKIERTAFASNTKVIIYDKTKKAAHTASYSDISIGDKIIVYSRYNLNRFIVIYKD